MKKLGLLVFLLFILEGCVPLSGFEEGRTLREEQSSLQINFNFLYPITTKDESQESNLLPFADLVYKHGFTDQFEVGIKGNTSGFIGLQAKRQVIGDKQSPFALSLGIEVYNFALRPVLNTHIPIYMSYYPNDKWTFNLSPRYNFQIQVKNSIKKFENFHMIGGNVGVMYGRKHKLGFDIGFNNAYKTKEILQFLNFGIGGKFVFGGSK